jgi:hypothetical protein
MIETCKLTEVRLSWIQRVQYVLMTDIAAGGLRLRPSYSLAWKIPARNWSDCTSRIFEHLHPPRFRNVATGGDAREYLYVKAKEEWPAYFGYGNNDMMKQSKQVRGKSAALITSDAGNVVLLIMPVSRSGLWKAFCGMHFVAIGYRQSDPFSRVSMCLCH